VIPAAPKLGQSQICTPNDIGERYFESSYCLTPNDAVGAEAYAGIRDAMRGKDMVALGRIVLSKRERVVPE